MKKLEAFIPRKAEKTVRSRLMAAGFSGFTSYDIEGQGSGRSHVYEWGGEKFDIKVFPKAKLEIVVADSAVEKAAEAVIAGVKDSGINNGKLFISTIDDVIKVDGTRGEKAAQTGMEGKK